MDHVENEVETYKVVYGESDCAPDFVCTCADFLKLYVFTKFV